MRCLHVYVSSHKHALYFTKNHAICIIFLTSCVLKWISYLNMCSKLVNNTIDTKTTNICVLSYIYFICHKLILEYKRLQKYIKFVTEHNQKQNRYCKNSRPHLTIWVCSVTEYCLISLSFYETRQSLRENLMCIKRITKILHMSYFHIFLVISSIYFSSKFFLLQ